MRLLRRLAWPLLIAVVTCGVLFLGVFPTRTYLSQRAAIAAAEEQLDELTARNAELQHQVDLLGTDAEVERLAREQFGLARPGEEVYQVLPPPEDPVEVPDVWPFNRLRQRVEP
ncbi:FtsB family cell division protein [Rhabdothermincola sp.]|uniref:FtsB family cell division protein n=1 Tax=Rhabdothermincola sp. TaxID=2820405 RepID=UPI002FDF62D6